MITIYLLKNCPYCKNIDEYVKEHPSLNICLIYVSHMNYPGLNKFPIAFNSLPNKNGLPNNNSISLSGSNKIMKLLKENTSKNKFGKIIGNEIEVHNTNTGPLQNINKKMNSCFNGNCNTRMDRPYGPCDNKYLLDNSQPKDALPRRTNIPVFSFGKTKKSIKPKSIKSKSIKPKSIKPKSIKSKSIKPKNIKSKNIKSKNIKSKSIKSKKNKKVLTTPLGIEIYIE